VRHAVQIDDRFAELGGSFTGSIGFVPDPEDRIRNVRLQLIWRTQSRASEQRWGSPEIEVFAPTTSDGESRWRLDVPFDAPITYHGHLFSVHWEILVTVDVRRKIDDGWAELVNVVPISGDHHTL